MFEHLRRGLGAVILARPLITVRAHEGAATEPPFWKSTPEQISERVGTVRAGRDLTPRQWPGGARVAVSLSFDVDTEAVWIGLQGQGSPSCMSRDEFDVARPDRRGGLRHA